MVEWARRFDCPIHLHAADAEWIMRSDRAIKLWHGETRDLGHGLTLIRCGGHFRGGTILHRAEGAGGALLTGDIIQIVPDRTHVAFMWSYPNLVPLPEAEVDRMVAAVGPSPTRHLRRLVGRDHPVGRPGRSCAARPSATGGRCATCSASHGPGYGRVGVSAARRTAPRR